MKPAMLQIPGLKWDFLSSRTSPVAQVTTATSASNAPETSAAGAPIMGSVRMVTMGTGSAVAMKVSMAPHARTVSRDDTVSTAPQVRNTLIQTETLRSTHSFWRSQDVFLPRGSIDRSIRLTKKTRAVSSTSESNESCSC